VLTLPFARTVSLPDGSTALVEVFVTLNAVADPTVAIDTSDLDAALDRFARTLPVPSTREVRIARSAAWLETRMARHDAIAAVPRLVVDSTPAEDVEEYDETSKSDAFLARQAFGADHGVELFTSAIGELKATARHPVHLEVLENLRATSSEAIAHAEELEEKFPHRL
jgi:hypothetical protein